MQNPYAILGVNAGAEVDEIRAAYHARVKRCHPDGMQDEQAQQDAQAELVALNLAYAEAMRQANFRRSNHVTIVNAKAQAERLIGRGQFDGALRMLNKSPDRDAAWFALQGRALLGKGDAEAAHACFRSAVRMEPEYGPYRALALEAAVQMRNKSKRKAIRSRMGGWARALVSRMT